MPPRRRHRHSRLFPILFLTVLALLLLLVLAGAGVLLFVDPNAWRPRIEAEVQRATGRALQLGQLRLVPALSPTLEAEDVRLANMPGGSRPEMLTVAQAEVKLALLPLLTGRIEVARLQLVRPDILLETDADGRPNWRFGPTAEKSAADKAGDAGAPPAAAPAASPGSGPDLLVRSLRLEDGQVTWRDGATGRATVLAVKLLKAGAAGVGAPVTASAEGRLGDQPLVLTAETGPLARLLDPVASDPWPVAATLEIPGARLGVTGTVTRPLQGRGYALTVEGAAVNLSALEGLLGRPLPPLRQVAVAARVEDAGTDIPRISGIAVRAGESALDGFIPGLQLSRMELSAARLEEPVRADVEGSLRGTRLRVSATLGAPTMLLAAAGPFPIELAAEAAGATLVAKGGLAAPLALSGLDLGVTARIPDVAALAPLAGQALPALRQVTMDARLRDGSGGLARGIAVRGLALTAPQADLSGEAELSFGDRPAVQANLTSRRIDADAILGALPAGAGAEAAPQATPPADPPAPAASRPARLIPATKLPFAALDRLDADLRFAVAELRAGGVLTRDLSGHAVLREGTLAVDPVTGTLPGGRLELALTAGGRQSPPPVALTLRAPGMSLGPLLAAFGLPQDMGGTAELDADLRGAGETPQAIAATLSGRLGVAMVDAGLDNQVLGLVLGEVLRAAKLPAEVLAPGGVGQVTLRCLAVRADADSGLVQVGPLVVDAGRLLVQGAGTVNLRDEGLALRLRPMLRAGTSVVVPVRVGGTLLEPKFGPDPGGTAGALAGFAAGMIAGRNPQLGALLGERGGDACGPALAAARGGRAGAEPKTAPPQAGPLAPRLPKPADLLRQLTR
ncbi:AsmA family protein [Rhodovastum atsumiense]|uniref:AsmA family protein n=1 Tax=Rhodovastum atsumiense TaxID=504468 RepID=A0A5M6ISS1_9PROT|nr:AsmA family protein [Rhodovastum atsumiense]KAA5611251.1 AsmA family protein [Rhodovastum atsumiense]CAH2603987.1 AsmA family protein [Rhodovastum atsumiense]